MIRKETTASVAEDQLRSYFERWNRLEEEKRTVSDDLKELFAEAKSFGFDTKAMRAVFRDEVADQAERQEAEAIYDLYAAALKSALTRVHPRDAREKRDNSGESRERQTASNVPLAPVPASKPEAPLLGLEGGNAPAGTAATISIARPRPEMRPHCQNKAQCAGVGFEHCYPCKKAAGLVGEAA